MTLTDILLIILILLSLQSIHTQFKHFKYTTTIMATLQDITASLDALKTAEAAVGTELTTLNGKLASAISATDADTIKSEIDAITAVLTALVPAPAEPVQG